MQINKVLIAGALVASMSTLTGCVVAVGGDGFERDDHISSNWQDIETSNRNNLLSINHNMPYQKVIDKMGTPDFFETYHRQDEMVKVLFYRTQRKKGDGATTKDECTPILNINGLVTAIGETAYAKL